MKNTLLVIPAALGILAIGRLTPALFEQAPAQTSVSSAPALEVDQGWP